MTNISLNFKSKFDFSKYPVKKNSKNGIFVKTRHTTVVCTVGEENPFVLAGTAICHPKDKDNPTLGQKFALRKALSNLEDKGLRKQIWDAFAKYSTSAAKLMGRN